MFGDQTSYRLDTLFGAVWSCLVVFDKIFRPSKIRSETLNIAFVLLFDGRCFVRLDSLSNMLDAGMRTTLAQWLVSIVWAVFDATRFNRLATHFKISMFGHQTMFDGVWSPNISRLSGPLEYFNASCSSLLFSCHFARQIVASLFLDSLTASKFSWKEEKSILWIFCEYFPLQIELSLR